MAAHHDQPPPTDRQLSNERLATVCPGRIVWCDPARARRESGSIRIGRNTDARHRVAARPIDERQPAVGPKQEADSDVAAGLATVLVVEGRDLTVGVDWAAGRSDR